VLGLDGSYSRDATALVAVQMGEFPHLSVVGIWERPPGQPEWTVPILDVEEAIRTACLRWSVREITADPHLWSRSLELLASENLPVTEFPQSPSRMGPATQRMQTMILERQMTHDGNPALTRHVSNCVLVSDSRGMRVKKEHRNSDRKIDAAVASIMALERAMQHVDEPAAPEPFFIN